MLAFSFPQFPLIETDRLILRGPTMKDIEPLYQLRTNPEVLKNIFKEPMKLMQESIDLVNKIQDDYENSNGINWAVTLKLTGEMIGMLGLWRIIKEHYRAEIGYTLLPQYWNQGLISEAMKSVLNFTFTELKIHSIEANLDPANNASEKVLLKAGFMKEGYFKEDFFFRGKFYDTLTYGIVNPNKTIIYE